MSTESLPIDLDAERFVLGALLNHGVDFGQIAGTIQSDDFSLDRHRQMYGVMVEMYERGDSANGYSLGRELHKRGKLDTDGLEYISGLNDGIVQIVGVDGYLKSVQETSIRRKAIQAHKRAMERLYDPANETPDVIAEAECALRSITDSATRQGSMRTPGEVWSEYPGGFNAFMDPSKNQGLPTPWAGLGKVYTGFKPGQLVTLAARPGVGKSAAAAQIAEYVAEHAQAGVALFSLEMSASEILSRMGCARAHVDSHRWRNGYLSRDEKTLLQTACSEIAALPLWIDDTTGCTIPALHSAIRKLKVRENIGLVIVDYLQLMETIGQKGNRNEQISSISRGLKLAAREFHLPFLVLAQLNRAGEKDGHREPILSDLRDSGAIEQDSDVVMFLHAQKPEPGETPNGVVRTKLIVKKQRNGPSNKHVEMVFVERFAKFQEVAYEG